MSSGFISPAVMLMSWKKLLLYIIIIAFTVLKIKSFVYKIALIKCPFLSLCVHQSSAHEELRLWEEAPNMSAVPWRREKLARTALTAEERNLSGPSVEVLLLELIGRRAQSRHRTCWEYKPINHNNKTTCLNCVGPAHNPKHSWPTGAWTWTSWTVQCFTNSWIRVGARSLLGSGLSRISGL